MSRLITLLTDFGTQDAFVGVMKGVIKSIAPDAEIIDLTHHVPPQDIRAGAFLLGTACRSFPPGTIHLAVVDPGVGSARRPVAAHIGNFTYVCPDNGLLSHVLSQNTLHHAVTLDNARFHLPQVSRTFHGRDIFAPVAAHLAVNVSLDTLGTPLDTLQTFPLSQTQVSDGSLTCHVVYCDVFGNVFLDLMEDRTETGGLSRFVLQVSGQAIPGPVDSYSDVPIGAALALFGSSGHLEIAVRNGNAQQQFGLRAGDTLTLLPLDRPG